MDLCKYGGCIRLLAAFVIFAALLMFFSSIASMFESWDNTKAINKCLAASLDETMFSDCQKIAKDSLDIYVRVGQESLTFKQIYSIFALPVASFFLWIALLLFGVILYMKYPPAARFVKKKKGK